MVCANPGFVYCPRLQVWRSPEVKTKVCPFCQYLGCEQNLQYLVQVPTECAGEGAKDAQDRTLEARSLPLQLKRPVRPITGYCIKNMIEHSRHPIK